MLEEDHGRAEVAQFRPIRRGARQRFVVYLAGSIQKGRADERTLASYWSAEDEAALRDGVVSTDLHVLNPAHTRISRADVYANFGCDLHLVSISDAVLVDARTKKGLGVGAEMMFAQFVGVQVITVCPPDSPYRHELLTDVYGEDLANWIHPFVYGLSDFVVDTVTEAAQLIESLGHEGLQRKSRPDVADAIEYYNRVRESLDRAG